MKKLTSILSFTIILTIIIIVSCKKDLPESPAGLTNKITLKTDSINISYRSADVYTSVETGCASSLPTGINITQHGHCWDTISNPQITDGAGGWASQLGKLTQPGTFTSHITELLPNKKYYVKGYIQFDEITLYTEQDSFITKGLEAPTVTTTPATNVTETSATTGGNVTGNGGDTIIARGVCYSTSQNPTVSNDTTLNGTGTGTFISSITGLSPDVTYYVRAYAINNIGTAYGNEINFLCTAPSAPTAGTHTPSQTQIIWKWNTVAGATGYKWNTTNNYSTATDMGTNTSKTETGLTCETAYPRYVWAYNVCGNSSSTTLNQTTSTCPFICGGTLTINHTIGAVCPETKTVNYGTVLTSLTGDSKCWITQNLGADNQASSATDATDAAAGWYWQFNRKQGYAVGPTPAWTITAIDESSDWIASNDPCTIELGTGWRIPTYTEWLNADANGGWNNYNDTYSSVLKLHAAGYLLYSNGSLGNRGTGGNYWSSTQNSGANGWHLDFYSSGSYMNGNSKAYGFSLRCLRD